MWVLISLSLAALLLLIGAAVFFKRNRLVAWGLGGLSLVPIGLVAWLFVVIAVRGIGPGGADFFLELPSGYRLHRMSSHQVFVAPEGWGSVTPMIPAKVVDVAWDSHFVIAKQQPMKRRSPEDPNDTYEEPVEGEFRYWILEPGRPAVHGPFDEVAFRSARIEFGVAPGLKLRSVYSYAH
jgi:hypothetical protein